MNQGQGSPYARVVSVFDELGVKTSSELERFLATAREAGSFSGTYGELFSGAKEDSDRLARRLATELNAAITEAESAYAMSGIHQFSLSDTSRVQERDLKKSLFLARTTTLFSPHDLSWSSRTMETDEGEELRFEDWSISHDFVRDLFAQRALLERGDLVLLPRTLSHDHGWGWRYKHEQEVRSLLEEIANTRVLNVGVDTSLLDRILAQYRKSKQLVVLPEMHVPWIDGISLQRVVDIRSENADELASFQRCYHTALSQYIETHGSLDFASISAAISGDLVDPALRALERKYRRTLSMHSSLTKVGAGVAVIPILGVIVSGELLGSLSASDLTSATTTSLAAIAGTIATNFLQRKRAIGELGDSEYAVLWNLAPHAPASRYAEPSRRRFSWIRR